MRTGARQIPQAGAPRPLSLPKSATAGAAAGAAAAPSAEAAARGGAPVRLTGDVMKTAGAAPAPPGDDPVALLETARGLAFSGGRLERAGRAAAAASAAGLSIALRESGGDVSVSNPFYGRYLAKWLESNPADSSGRLLAQLLRQRLGELNRTMRSVH